MILQNFFVAVLAITFAFTGSSFGQGAITLMHDSSWEVVGRDVTIRVAHILNTTTEDSGPLFLSLYARPTTVYDGTGSPGQLIARAPLDNIPAGQTLENAVVTTRAKAIRPGAKFTTLAIERHEGRKFTIVDWVVYTSLYSFARGQTGGVGSEDGAIGNGDIAVTSPTLTVKGRRGTFNIPEIQDQRPSDTTGLLRVAVYATDGNSNQLVGSRVLGWLAPGDFYTDLQGNLTLKRPRGRAFSSYLLAIEEQQDAGWIPIATTEATH